jgi:hypothetical protein
VEADEACRECGQVTRQPQAVSKSRMSLPAGEKALVAVQALAGTAKRKNRGVR